MEQQLNSKLREKSYLRIVDTVMEMIENGQVQYGERLYNEQELVNMLGVSRPTLREALRVLEFLGVVTVVPHKGISINKPNQIRGYLPLLYILSFEKTTGKELFQVRQALQLESAAQAAIHRTPEDVQALRQLLVQMEEKIAASGEEFAQTDDMFHQKLLEISGNRLMCKLMETIHPMIRNQLDERIRRLPMEKREKTVLTHRRIVDYVEAGDDIMARQAMYEHLTGSRQEAGNEPITFTK